MNHIWHSSIESQENVASLCVFYRHIFLQPSIELADTLPSEALSMRATISSESGHPYCERIPRSKTELYLNSYIPRTSRLWNSLPASAFPASPNMTAFKIGRCKCFSYGSDVLNRIGLNQIKCDCFHLLVVMVLSVG